MRTLQTEHLTKRYGSFAAVRDVSLTLGSGVYGLLGANGAGKTTLMRMLCGILDPTEGTVRCDGAEITRLGEDYRALLGYLPQDFGCYPDFTGAEFLRYIAALKGLTRAETRRRTAQLLEQVGLADAGRKKLRAYSGGMRQRLGIAQAMLNDPEILILDEPTAGLDPRERVRFRNLIADYAKGRTVLLSTHIVSDVEAIADRILLMKNGAIADEGTVAELAQNARGKVWTLRTDGQTAARLESVYNVANLRHEGEGVELRLITADPPAGAVAAEPTLEDVYLWHFAEEEQP
ncbi:ABC transporter ATP-binding protein [Subdoligranulum variabile]|uniref:ABC transporter, ATP-binding protein n=1 Tax=Subdoligranulum variabile DSM 15176 TaxID=411471 RepID=D1PQJ4_9FIRM|nr:ABC transporter ATP-binding protein [Subdoligranulum variabile]EFB75036.1 ABC transporter, ATP-binding protein [Subdoligranulum variabile DSM 15176]UWP66851.1 ABC transporter ATP-binding protein [Subdoligranulum variabile]